MSKVLNLIKRFVSHNKESEMLKDNIIESQVENDDLDDSSEIWDASRVVDTIADLLSYETGPWLTNSSACRKPIERKKLASVLNAYGYGNKFMYDSSLLGLVSTASPEKIKEIKEILYSLSSKPMVDAFWDKITENALNQSYIMENLFVIIIFHYATLRRLAGADGRCIEGACGGPISMLYMIEDMYKIQFSQVMEKMKCLLVLLLGDEFDKTVIEPEAMEKYDSECESYEQEKSGF